MKNFSLSPSVSSLVNCILFFNEASIPQGGTFCRLISSSISYSAAGSDPFTLFATVLLSVCSVLQLLIKEDYGFGIIAMLDAFLDCRGEGELEVRDFLLQG